MEANKEEILNYINKLEIALTRKQEWFNTERLQEMLNHYRMHYTCIKNLNDLFIKKSLIEKDPYKLDRRISDIVPTDTSAFNDSDTPHVLGARLSDYEMMLDFICTYYRFSVENITVSRIKTMLELNKTFDWENLSVNSASMNTKALASVVQSARTNAPAVLMSAINDSLEKSAQSISQINRLLAELIDFQRELYKGRLRKDIFEHPEFNSDFAFSSPENELSEIKRLYTKVIGKKNFYKDLINEIIEEDQGLNGSVLRQNVLNKLEFIPKAKTDAKKKTGPNAQELLTTCLNTFGFFAPVIAQFSAKLRDDFDLLFAEKKNLITKIKNLLRKLFAVPPKTRICNLPVIDSQSGVKSIVKINVNEFLDDIEKKVKIYSSISAHGAEYSKITSKKDVEILNFINTQLKENQQLFTTINSLDDYFKATVEVLLKPKLKGLKVDLSAYRNIIIDINKKRGEYVAFIEEEAQLKKLGIQEQ